MLSYDEMPEDNAELAKVAISFPRLEPDDASKCPYSIEELLSYLELECPDGESPTSDDLAFVRTAIIEQTHYWIWHFAEPDGAACYLTVAASGGSSCIGYDENSYELSPEQFILGDYHNVF